MTPNTSKFVANEDEQFTVGTRVLVAPENVGNYYLTSEFRRDTRKFLKDFMNCTLSAVAASSVTGQGLSCFCPPISIYRDDHAAMQLFGMLLDGLLEEGWVKGAEMEAYKSAYQSFEQDQRQVQWTSARSRPDVGNVLTFCTSQVGFAVRHHLYKTCIVSKHVGFSFNVVVVSFALCSRFFS